MGCDLRVCDGECACTGYVEAVEEARHKKAAEPEHLDQRSHHDEGHALDGPVTHVCTYICWC